MTSDRQRGIFEKRSGSGIFWIRYADAAGKIRREKAGTKAVARKLYQLRKTEVLQGKKLPESLRRKPVTFRDIAKDALEYSQTHKRSFVDDQERMKVLVEWFGDTAAESLTPQQIERKMLAAAKERNWKPATINRYKALLSLVFRIATDNGKVQANPVRRVRRLQEHNGVVRYLNPDEESKLRTAIEPKHPERWAAVVFAMNTGLRASEQFGLRWSGIDFKHRQLRLALTKNGTARYVSLNDAALGALWIVDKHHPRSTEKDLVFPPQPYRMWFEIALKKAGVTEFSWHCLRHTFASRLVMAGADMRTVAELMGHKSLQMTMRYAHLAPEHKAAAVALLDGFGKTTGTKIDTAPLHKVVAITQVAVNE